jgi:hypothetical protein
MKRLTVLAAAASALLGSPPLLAAITTPAFAQEWRESHDEISDREMRDAFLDRLRVRQDIRDLLEDRLRSRMDRDDISDMFRHRLRERLADWRERDEDSDGGRRGRLRERLAERIHGHDRDDCYFFTRSLRDQDGDFLVIVRRRVCRD